MLSEALSAYNNTNTSVVLPLLFTSEYIIVDYYV